MCAYHNSCGHGTGVITATHAHLSPETSTEPSPVQPQHQLPPQTAQQQRCFHSQDNVQVGNNLGRPESTGLKMVKGGSGEEDDADDSDDAEDDDAEDDDDVFEVGSRSQSGLGHVHEDENDGSPSRKRARRTTFSSQSQSQLLQQISSEVLNAFQDGSTSFWDKKQWMKLKLIQLEEQQVNCQAEACELEKQRLKWVKYSSKREREMERAKLENERRRLENLRMVVLIRQKEFELLNLHHQQQRQQNSTNNNRSDPSSITG